MLSTYNSVWIYVGGDALSAWSGDLHGAPGLVEQIGENAYLTSGGVMFGTVTGGPAVSGSFDGVIEQCELSEEWGGRRNCSASATIANQSCTSSTHRMILARR